MRLWSVVVSNASRPGGLGVGWGSWVAAIAGGRRATVIGRLRCSATQRSNSSASTTRTLKPMRQWSRPQNSAQRPSKVPMPVGRDVDLVVDAGDQVALGQELGHPEGVVHVGGAELEAGDAVDRQHQLGEAAAGRAGDGDVERRGSGTATATGSP